MKKLFLLFISLCIMKALAAQLSGTIVNAQHEPVFFANVSIVNSNDSLISHTVVADNEGKFVFPGISAGTYSISVKAIGYADTTAASFYIDKDQQKDLGVFIVRAVEKQLDEVIVRAEKPLYQQNAEGLVVNVENSILTQGSSALQALERSPGVVINRRDNSIELNGKSGVMVMLNGKLLRMSESQLIEILNGMSADDISKIELLTSPSAKYDAEGSAGIINIVLKKNKLQGTNGVVNLSAGYGYKEKATAGFNLAHNTAKLNLYGSYNFSHNNTYSNMYVDSRQNMPFLGGEMRALVWDTTFSQQNNHNLNIGTDITLNANTTMGGSIIYGNNKSRGITYSHLSYTVLPDSILQYDGSSSGKSIWNNVISSVYAEHAFRKAGKLNAGIDYIYFNYNAPYSVQGNFVNKHGEEAGGDQALSAPQQEGFANTNIHIVAGKLDHSIALNKQLQLESGLKTSMAKSNSYAGFESLVNEVWTSDPQIVNDILMKEKIIAAYTSLSGNIQENMRFTAGIRYEHTLTNMYDAGTNKQVVHRKFSSFFPNLLFTKKLNEHMQLQLSYTKRITRPTYNDLASYIVYSDPTAVNTGNPFLQPTITNNVKFGYSYKKYAFSVQYSHDVNVIARYQLTESPQHDILYVSPQNISWQNALTFQSILPFKVSNWWTMSYNLIGSFYRYKITHTSQPFVHDYFNYYLQTTQLFKMPKQFSAELSGSYYNVYYSGTQKVNGIVRMNLGVKKELKNNKGSFQLSVTDVLMQEKYNIHYGTLATEAFSINNNVIFYTESTRAPIFKLSYSRSFGNNKTNISKRNNTADEQERIRRE